MIGKILGSGQLGKLATFVSPAFFDVMPARALWSRGKTLLADSRNTPKLRQVITQRAETLALTMPTLRLSMPLHVDAASSAQRNRELDSWRAPLIAELYFRQLFLDDVNAPTLLDLRATAFTTDGKVLAWSPAPWVATWSPEFIGALREIYLGFYGHDDALFRHGLTQLNLAHSEDLFREQFGAGQDRVKFHVRAFIDVFQRVFERCKQHKTNLHPDFLPLGIYLAALYDHLQELGIAVNVADAFARATAPNSSTNAADPSSDTQERHHA
ncbi:MAG TPA: hypothetical protein VFN67_22360 [Polyangiales bacterium]|nr:hypothetical protein [Polyangiales bacterium]